MAPPLNVTVLAPDEMDNGCTVPAHITGAAGVITGAGGLASTVTAAETVVLHPLVTVYSMVAEPAATPVTTPVLASTVAAAGFVLLQVPPAVALVNVIVWPAQTDDGPVIGATVGAAVIVTRAEVTTMGQTPTAGMVYVTV
jgi:hypothetical protein